MLLLLFVSAVIMLVVDHMILCARGGVACESLCSVYESYRFGGENTPHATQRQIGRVNHEIYHLGVIAF